MSRLQGLMCSYPLALPHAVERAERLFADKTVVTRTRNGLERATYADWGDRTRRLAAALDELGVSKGGCVATVAWNDTRHLELYFGAPCSGRVLHPVNVRLSAEQIAYTIEHAGDEVAFVDRSLLGTIWPIVEKLDALRSVVVMDDGGNEGIPDDPRIVDYEQLVTGCQPVELSIEDEDRAATICYSSGTTGQPKGVVYSHRAVLLHALSIMLADTLAVSERDVVLPVVPMFHVSAWGLPHAAVLAGASLVLPGADVSPESLAELIETERVSLAAGVPTIWREVLPALEGRDASSLERIVCGGSAVAKELSEAYRERIGIPLLQAWGMTETGPVAAVCRIKSTLEDTPDDELVERRASVGVPSPLVECRIDGSSAGELQVRGPWVAASYLRDSRSADSFTPDGWLRTGDVATVDEHGYIRIVDRTKDLVKSGGEWISSVELENEIIAHPGVHEAAVIGVPDSKWGERPLACVVPAPGAELTADDVREFLRDRVVKWWIPDDVVFVDTVPKTSVGKVDKAALRAHFPGKPTAASPGRSDG